MSRPLIKSTWSPSLRRGRHRSAGVLGATRDTMTGVSWSEPPCTLQHNPYLFTTTLYIATQFLPVYNHPVHCNTILTCLQPPCTLQHNSYLFTTTLYTVLQLVSYSTVSHPIQCTIGHFGDDLQSQKKPVRFLFRFLPWPQQWKNWIIFFWRNRDRNVKDK